MDSVSHAPRCARGGAIAAPLAERGLARASGRRSPYLLLGAASLLLAAATLPLQAAPSYDPWAWIIWGREILHVGLLTTGGPTWKPLPVIFTTVFAPFGAAAPDLWLILARASGIMAVGLAAITTARLADGTRRRALIGVAICAIGLVTLDGFVASVVSGESEGLLVALVLLAILRHLDGEPRQAFALGVAAALLRPETWPFLALYGVDLWRRDPAARAVIALCAGAVVALWFLPELWGSGSLLRGVRWAQHPRAGSPALAHCPSCAEITSSAWPLLTMPLKIGVVLAAVLAVRGHARRVSVAIIVLGLGWILEEALFTQLGFSGNDRYLLAPVAVLIAVAASGWASLLARPRAAIATAALALLLSVPAYGKGPHLRPALRSLRQQDSIAGDLTRAIQGAGGRLTLLACGSIQTNPSEVPAVAWVLRVPMTRTESGRGEVVIASPGSSDGDPPPAAAGAGYRLVAAAGSVRVFERCAPS